MGCGEGGSVTGADVQQILVCNRNVNVCGTINLPLGFRLSDQGNLQFSANGCLECRTEAVTVECMSDEISNCMVQMTAVRAVGCFNYIISVPVEPINSSCSGFAYVSVENSACVDQLVCLRDSTFVCDPVEAVCDINFIFVGASQQTLAPCTDPTRLDVQATLRLFGNDNICPSTSLGAIQQNMEFDRIQINPDYQKYFEEIGG